MFTSAGRSVTRRATLVAALAMLVAAFAAVSASARADADRGGAAHAKSKHKLKAHKKHSKSKKAAVSAPLHGVVPPAQVAIFGVLKAPPTHELPSAISRTISDGPPVYKALGIDVTQAREVGPDMAPFFIVPGTSGICLFMTDGGSVCSQRLDRVATYGLSVDVVNPAPRPGGSIDPTGFVVTYGVAPDGFSAVTAVTSGGKQVTAGTSRNGYLLATDGPIASRTLTGPGRDPVSDASVALAP